jgi:hypothetical protein
VRHAITDRCTIRREAAMVNALKSRPWPSQVAHQMLARK